MIVQKREYDDFVAAVMESNLYDVAVNLMDDEIREQLHRELAPCSNEEFLKAYCKSHFDKYGEEFTI